MDTLKYLDYTDLFSAKGLVVCITGGGTGIGLALAAALFRTSARRVYILGRREPALQSAAASIDSSGEVVVPIQCDVTSQESISAAVGWIKKDMGYVDVLINNAGVLGPSNKKVYEASSIEELQAALLNDPSGWDSTFATNSAAVVLVSAAFLSLLNEGNQRRGWEGGKVEGSKIRFRSKDQAALDVDANDERCSQIITISSIAAFNRFITAGIAYSTSKAAAIHAAKILATLLGPWNIRSNVIAPGIYPSEMTKLVKPALPTSEVPAQHQGTFEDISGVILYLVGKSGAYVNGNVQVTDGGRLSVFPATY